MGCKYLSYCQEIKNRTSYNHVYELLSIVCNVGRGTSIVGLYFFEINVGVRCQLKILKTIVLGNRMSLSYVAVGPIGFIIWPEFQILSSLRLKNWVL